MTYIIIPAVNSSSRIAEIKQRAETWANENNLEVNPAKYMEIVFVDKRRKVIAKPPPPLPGIERVTRVKILGVKITNSLSVAKHVHATISSCAQTLCSQSHGRPCAADCIPLRRHRPVAVCIKCMHDGDSLRPQSDIALTHSSVVAHAVDLYHLTCRRLKLSAAQLTKN